MPVKGSHAPGEAPPNLGGKRTNNATTPLARNSQMISDSVQAVASPLAAKRTHSMRSLASVSLISLRALRAMMAMTAAPTP